MYLLDILKWQLKTFKIYFLNFFGLIIQRFFRKCIWVLNNSVAHNELLIILNTSLLFSPCRSFHSLLYTWDKTKCCCYIKAILRKRSREDALNERNGSTPSISPAGRTMVIINSRHNAEPLPAVSNHPSGSSPLFKKPTCRWARTLHLKLTWPTPGVHGSRQAHLFILTLRVDWPDHSGCSARTRTGVQLSVSLSNPP